MSEREGNERKTENDANINNSTEFIQSFYFVCVCVCIFHVVFCLPRDWNIILADIRMGNVLLCNFFDRLHISALDYDDEVCASVNTDILQ